MSPRLLKWLAGVLVLLGALIFATLFWKRPPDTAPFREAIKTVQRVRLQWEQGTLDFERDGPRWRVSSGEGAPRYRSDDQKTNMLINGLSALEMGHAISEGNGDSAKVFGVNPSSGTVVRLYNAEGKLTAEGTLGKESSDRAHLYFRDGDRPDVYLARGMPRWLLGGWHVHSWRSWTMLSLDPETIERVRIETPRGTALLVRSEGRWTLNDKPLSPERSEEFVKVLSVLRTTELIEDVPPEMAPETLTHARLVVTAAGEERELLFGTPEAKSGRFPAHLKGEPGVGWISPSMAKSLFIASEETPDRS